jgi:uncharacterized alkaline shock family protein YloU
MTDSFVIRSDRGTVTVAPGVLSQVVVQSAESVEGARVRRPRRGLEVEVEGSAVNVSVEVAVRFGLVLPDVGREVQERVGEALGSVCGLETRSVDVSVEELDV